MTAALQLAGRLCYTMIRRQVVLPVGFPSHTRTNGKEDDHMTDYEMIMIFLTFLMVLLAVDKKNNG